MGRRVIKIECVCGGKYTLQRLAPLRCSCGEWVVSPDETSVSPAIGATLVLVPMAMLGTLDDAQVIRLVEKDLYLAADTVLVRRDGHYRILRTDTGKMGREGDDLPVAEEMVARLKALRSRLGTVSPGGTTDGQAE